MEGVHKLEDLLFRWESGCVVIFHEAAFDVSNRENECLEPTTK